CCENRIVPAQGGFAVMAKRMAAEDRREQSRARNRVVERELISHHWQHPKMTANEHSILVFKLEKSSAKVLADSSVVILWDVKNHGIALRPYQRSTIRRLNSLTPRRPRKSSSVLLSLAFIFVRIFSSV
uniref:WD40 repeat domain containing protein n=1 Tax=Haemonchus contortus TaxID=6289 RepID=A0A7I5EDP2_HAECO